jgi:pyruvate,water dikinase
MASKTETCRLLADTEGPAAERFKHYEAFLNHNHRALRLLSELEMLDQGAGLSPWAAIQRRAGELVDDVRGLVAALEGISAGRYAELGDVCEAIVQELIPLITRERRPVEGPLTLPFAAIDAEALPLAGAKAVNLVRVSKEVGLPAPDGFVVTAAGSDLFLRENQLLEPVDAMLAAFDPDAFDSMDACRRIQAQIKAAILPPALAEAIDAAYESLAERQGTNPTVAVRSSAVGEDTEASFAGQYRSVLPVGRNALVAAYKEVLASKYDPRAILYRLRYGLTDAATPMAVAVVVLVQARASGVLYTVDAASTASGQVRIDAAPGMGENVVGGAASPDVFRIHRETLQVEQHLSLSRQGSGEADPEPPAIAPSTAKSLAEIGLKLEAHFGGPQDVEWAQNEQGDVFILQTRPLALADAADDAPPPDTSGLRLILAGGQTACPGSVSGRAVHAAPDLTAEGARDAILVARAAAPDLAPLMGRVRGLITDLGGVASHLASVTRELNVPALLDTREATSQIPDGQPVTLLADAGEVYLGEIDVLARKLPAREAEDASGPIGRLLRELLERISPLNLTDPAAPEFAPSGCRSLHDVIRFAHEKAMAEMFDLSKLADASTVSRKMSANIPLALYFIDLGGGLTPEMTSCDEILPEHIRSKPMAALWRGLAHPGVSWSGTVDFSGRNFMALMAGSMGPENRVPPKVDSYALVSEDYLNLSVKFGYHYSNIDALCSDTPEANAVRLQFAGGAGTSAGKALRIAFLEEVLTRLGYTVEVHGDMLQAVYKGGEAAALEEALDQTGRLLGCSRLLDLAIPSQAEVETLTDLFFKGDYDLLGRSENRLPGYYASVGEWSTSELGGEEVIQQDGAHMSDTVSCTLHSAMEKVVGGRYRTFLENRHARHYYPVAVKRGSRRTDGPIRVEVRIGAGCIDLAAGLAFGLTNVGNSLVLAADASAGELQLLEFVNNTRHFRQRVPAEIALDRWLQLEVVVDGNMVTGAMEGERLIRFENSRPVEGYVGLWSKGDSTAYFRNLDYAI